MSFKHLVVIGASAGGIEALKTLARELPPDFNAPICVVVHVAPQSPGVLHQILSRAGHLTALSPDSSERLRPGTIYVAPPDRHMLIEPGRIRLARGPRENRFRPAIDPLFRSAAQSYGPAAIGVILTGNLDDGTAGLSAVKQLGGVSIVQDPNEAMFPSMPCNALANVRVDHVVPLAAIPALLVELTSVAPPDRVTEVPTLMDVENRIANDENPIDAGLESLAYPSPFACPECHGVLLQLKDAMPPRFRCHTGHAYSIESLLAAVNEGIEEALWNSIRALEEGALLVQRIYDHLAASHEDWRDPAHLKIRMEQARAQSEAIRKLAEAREPLAFDTPSPARK
jgi:two-component system, chemotaxis family, protein-glutamate methylesterase/glutaminase